MRAIVPLLPVFNHRLGLAYVAALARRDGHDVVPVDFEHILRLCDPALSLDLQDETEVYADRWSREIQYFHRPELLCGALFPDDGSLRAALSTADWALIDRLRPHVRRWRDAVLALEPDLLLLPCLVSNLWMVLWLSAEVGQSAPAVTRVLGGRGVTYPQVRDLVLRAGWVDGVLTGEAEQSIGPLLAALTRHDRPRTAIPGYARLDGDQIVAPPTATQPVDLDDLPLPDLSGLPFPGATLRLYGESGREFHDAVSLATSRWCPYQCAYCYESVEPRRYRLRGLDAVIAEIEHQHDRYGTPRLFFCDSTLNVSPPWLSQLADRMARLSWAPQVVFAHCEPTRLSESLLLQMRTAGFEKLNFGVEALDPRTLARMHRRPRIDEMLAVFENAVRSGVSLGLNLIANFPGETDDEHRTTVAGVSALAGRLGAVASDGAGVRLMVSQARIDPHSALFVNHAQHGVRITRRPIPVPRELAPLGPLLESMALTWTDGTPEAERRARFVVLRTYAESLSWPAQPVARRVASDPRVALNRSSVPPAIAALLPADAGRSHRAVDAHALAGEPA